MKILNENEKNELLLKLDNIDLNKYNIKEINLLKCLIEELSITNQIYNDYMVSQKAKLYYKNIMKDLNKCKSLNTKEINDIISYLNIKIDRISFDINDVKMAIK